MSEIFPRLNLPLHQAAGVVGPAALRSIEAIKQDVIAQLSKFPLGAQFPAEIIAKLSDNTFVVNVGTIPLRLALPNQQAKVGDKFSLSLLQTNPTLSFAIDGKQATAVFEPTPRESHQGKTSPQQVVAQLSKFPSGTLFRAEVVAKINDHTFVANIGNVSMKLTLPSQQVKVGDTLSLRLVSNNLNSDQDINHSANQSSKPNTNPSLTFTLDGKKVIAFFEPMPKESQSDKTQHQRQDENNGSVPRALPNPLSKDAASQLGTGHTSNTRQPLASNLSKSIEVSSNKHFNEALHAYQQSEAQASAHIDLSPTGKILAAVLGETSKPNMKLSIVGTSPLTDDITARANPNRLASRIETQLHKQIQQSGLFYESHVAQWANGQKDLSELQQEPQSTLSLEIENTILTDSNEVKHAALVQLVHQQLDILDQSRLSWTGHLSESVPMEMLIEVVNDDRQQAETAGGEHEKTWHTKINLRFPKLGEVQISVAHRNNSSDIKCKVERPELIPILHQHATELIKAFDASGNQLHSMKVSSK